MPVKYSVFKDLDCLSNQWNPKAQQTADYSAADEHRSTLIRNSIVCFIRVHLRSSAAQTSLVGPGGIEPPTSPLSGVRSSHLSYGPRLATGGAGRDRTGDLLNANQALSQLSYSPKFSIEASWMQKPGVLLPALSEDFVVS
jgi:hypothetical protein